MIRVRIRVIVIVKYSIIVIPNCEPLELIRSALGLHAVDQQFDSHFFGDLSFQKPGHPTNTYLTINISTILAKYFIFS